MFETHRVVEVFQNVTHSIKAKARLFEGLPRCSIISIKFGSLTRSPVCSREVKV
jgi:hypothetical protein